MFLRIDHRRAKCLTFSRPTAKAVRPLAASRHNCFAFALEGLCLDRHRVIDFSQAERPQHRWRVRPIASLQRTGNWSNGVMHLKPDTPTLHFSCDAFDAVCGGVFQFFPFEKGKRRFLGHQRR
jgi:hypothetical protein